MSTKDKVCKTVADVIEKLENEGIEFYDGSYEEMEAFIDEDKSRLNLLEKFFEKKATEGQNKISSCADLVGRYEDGGAYYDITDWVEEFIDETQGMVAQFDEFMLERCKEELNRPKCSECEEKFDEGDVHTINNDETLRYCDNEICREAVFDMAAKKLGWN
jgi:hypothetical protein